MSTADEIRDALRDAQADPSSPAWRLIERTLRAPHRDEDAVQEAMLAVFRSLRQLRAATAKGACGWLFTVLKHRAIDLERSAARRRSKLADVEVEDCADLHSTPRRDVDAMAALAATFAELERHVDALPRTRRSLHREHARAAILRLVFGLDGAELSEALEVELSRSQVDAWTARGRAVVRAACERWRAASAGDERVEAIVEVLVETMDRGRADAGVPRRSGRAA